MSTNVRDLLRKLKAKTTKDTDGNPTVFIAGERPDLLTAEMIPCNVTHLNKALGGGFAAKTIHVITGTEGVGKTSVAFSVIANAQQRGYVGVYINTESSLPSNQMKLAGVDLDELIFINTNDSADEILDQVYTVLYDNTKRRPNEVKVCMVLDSLDGLIPESTIKREEKKGVSSVGMAERPRLLSEFLSKITGRGMLREGSLFIFIAQQRVDLGAYGAPTKMSGGKAIKFMSKTILGLEKKLIREKRKVGTDEVWMPVGHEVKFTLEKNNASGRPTAGFYTYMYPDPEIGFEGGVDDSAAILLLALEYGIIEKEKLKYYLHLPDDMSEKSEKLIKKEDGTAVSKKQDILDWIKINTEIKEKIADAVQQKILLGDDSENSEDLEDTNDVSEQ